MEPKQFLPELKDCEQVIIAELDNMRKQYRDGISTEGLQKAGHYAGLAARLRMCIERIEERS